MNSLVPVEETAKVEEKSSSSTKVSTDFEVTMDGKLRVIKINRTERKNAFSTQMYTDFVEVYIISCLYR